MSIDLLKRRRDLLNGFVGEKPIVLPEGYTLGNYWNIQDWTCVDTRVIPVSNADFEMEIEPILTSWHFFLGFYANGYCFGCTSDGRAAINTTSGAQTNDVFFTSGVKTKVTGHLVYGTTSDNRYYVDGIDIGLHSGRIARYYLLLFSLNKDNSSTTRAFKGKCYYVKIWKNGELVRHYVPCLDSQGNGYMYDLVNENFVTPAVGTFVVE